MQDGLFLDLDNARFCLVSRLLRTAVLIDKPRPAIL